MPPRKRNYKKRFRPLYHVYNVCPVTTYITNDDHQKIFYNIITKTMKQSRICYNSQEKAFTKGFREGILNDDDGLSNVIKKILDSEKYNDLTEKDQINVFHCMGTYLCKWMRKLDHPMVINVLKFQDKSSCTIEHLKSAMKAVLEIGVRSTQIHSKTEYDQIKYSIDANHQDFLSINEPEFEQIKGELLHTTPEHKYYRLGVPVECTTMQFLVRREAVLFIECLHNFVCSNQNYNNEIGDIRKTTVTRNISPFDGDDDAFVGFENDNDVINNNIDNVGVNEAADGELTVVAQEADVVREPEVVPEPEAYLNPFIFEASTMDKSFPYGICRICGAYPPINGFSALLLPPFIELAENLLKIKIRDTDKCSQLVCKRCMQTVKDFGIYAEKANALQQTIEKYTVFQGLARTVDKSFPNGICRICGAYPLIISFSALLLPLFIELTRNLLNINIRKTDKCSQLVCECCVQTVKNFGVYTEKANNLQQIIQKYIVFHDMENEVRMINVKDEIISISDDE